MKFECHSRLARYNPPPMIRLNFTVDNLFFKRSDQWRK